MIPRGLGAVRAQYGKNAVAAYLGNPNVHNLAGLIYAPVFLRALGTRNGGDVLGPDW